MLTRNVLNSNEVDRFIKELANELPRADLRAWLNRTARRWILRHHDRYDRVLRDPATGAIILAGHGGDAEAGSPLRDHEIPDWCGDALDRGDLVVRLRLDAGLQKQIRRAASALAAELEEGARTSVERIDFPQACRISDGRRRERHAKRQAARSNQSVVPVHRTPNRGTVARLTRPESLEDEGRRMSNCVGVYWDDVASGDSEIYSLRDVQGQSRATLEVDSGGCVKQIKGFANGAVAPDHRLLLQGFIRARGYRVARGQGNLRVSHRHFKTDAGRLEHDLTERGGLARLSELRYAGHEAFMGECVPVLLWTIAANANGLSDKTLNALFDGLAPEREPVIRIRRSLAFWVYDRIVRVHEVRLPLILLNMIRLGVFRGRGPDARARALYCASEAALTVLALREPLELFYLGPSRPQERWRKDLLASPADVLAVARVDVSRLRALRHQALRQELNRAQRHYGSRRMKPSEAHVAVRALLDGANGSYVV